MTEPLMSNRIPTPFDLLVAFEDSGNATFVSYLLRERAGWLASNLTLEQKERVDQIEERLDSWLLAEKTHGRGAALNLQHKDMMAMFLEQPWLRSKYEVQINNARRLASKAKANAAA